jgi:hypothetical protein
MDDLDMGGNFESDFVFYLQFDLYTCKNGIDYDENNPNCSSYEKIIEAAGEDNSFTFDLYYPVVQYQPLVKENPLFVKYYYHFFHLSRFTNKIDRLYLQKYQLKDDNGWILKNIKTTNHWGVVSLTGDSYATGDKRDLMNEGSSSRLYSFNIYINTDIVNYNRNYKNIFLIISDGFPTVNIIFIIFRLIAKIFKISASNQKLTELLFENLQERSNKFKGIKSNTLILSKDKTIKSKYTNSQLKISQLNINNFSSSKIIETSSLPLNSGYDIGQRLFKNLFIKKKNSLLPHSENYKLNSFNHNNINKNRASQKNIEHHIKDNFYINNYNNNSNNNNTNKYNKNNINKFNNKFDKIKKIWSSKKKIYYRRNKLFPYKYYFCSIFIKNIDISKESFFFNKKFIAVYIFICQLFDVSSYFLLQREFQILKNILVGDKYKDFIESNRKINVNDQLFNINMKECLTSHKFSIFSKFQSSQDINQ